MPVRVGRATRVRMRGAVLGGGAGDGGHQPRVVDQLAVVGQQRAVETVAPDRGRQLDGAGRVDPA